ncbi:putative membrane protein [Methyloglobulus morosus KoM1]|uniref:Putative membrane protein n=2 Tax=Methyloglobulus TaxID=1410680 RepID=V5DYZ3_9GAMM|nr:putative membrane protein [Methyloglobulus morosus KoM1]
MRMNVFFQRAQNWLDRNVYDLARQMRLSYLPPMMVYLAAGVSGLTGIVGTFFVKDYLGLSAEFLASLGFWAMMPWTLKMPVGHLVDLLWQHKAKLIYLGAALIAASLLIMLNILTEPKSMTGRLTVETWFVIATLLAPIGYVIQDTVADAMTVEAVPRLDDWGSPIPDEQIKLAHTTMQTLGRVAIIGGTLIVALANIYWFRDVANMDAAMQTAIYVQIFRWALLIPVISVLGVAMAAQLRSNEEWRLAAQGYEVDDIERLLARRVTELPKINGWILGGGLAFALFAIVMGFSNVPYNEELIFVGSLAIVMFLLRRLTEELLPRVRQQLFGTALVIFAFRAIPSTGAGSTWWMIDELGFDQQFLSKLALISSGLTLFGMFMFRRFMAERTITEIIALLTIILTVLNLPEIALYYGFHEWTQTHIASFIDARFIALVDTALESPLGQIAMIPMLAWIANSAPPQLKATYFAVMAALINLALSLSQLLTKWLNQWFIVTREIKDPSTGIVTIPADYSQLGGLFFTVMFLGFAIPMLTIYLTQRTLLSGRKSGFESG